VVQAYGPLLDKLDLAYPQYLVMLALWERDDVMLKDLGARLYLDSGTLTPLLKRLEAKGYVQRQRSQTDERAMALSLTPLGRRLKQKARAIPEGLACRIALPVPELLKLRDELKTVLVALTEGSRL
jgi:DNA-binding MarR family transcriptional regulator